MQLTELKELYQQTSKHSNYQILPNALRDILRDGITQEIARFEEERMDFLKKFISFDNKRVLDIGGNTGYFSFEAIKEGASEVVHLEGNTHHSNFVRKAADYLNLNVKTYNQYLDFSGDLVQAPYDTVLLFNVIHHLGDDFGDNAISMEDAKNEMQKAINYFIDKTDTLVLQMGYCWKGNRNLLLFDNGTKQEMIDFVQGAIEKNWEIISIGVAEKKDDKFVYELLSDKNIRREDGFGEFLNRPIFVLKRK